MLCICWRKRRPIKTGQKSCNTAVSSSIQGDPSVLKVTCPCSLWKPAGRSKQQRSHDLNLYHVRVHLQTCIQDTILVKSSVKKKKKSFQKQHKKALTSMQTLLWVSLLFVATLTLCTLIKALRKLTNWASASNKADLLLRARSQQSHYASDNIQHSKLLKCSPSLKPEDCECTVKPNNEQAHSAYYSTQSCHLPLPRVRDSQLNLTGTYGKYLPHLLLSMLWQSDPAMCLLWRFHVKAASHFHLVSAVFYCESCKTQTFFKNRVRPRHCPSLTAMFYNDLVISLDAADLHCISLKLEWDLILLQPWRRASKKNWKKILNWMPDLFFRWLKCAVLPGHFSLNKPLSWRLVSMMSGCKALGKVCVFAWPFMATELSGRKN